MVAWMVAWMVTWMVAWMVEWLHGCAFKHNSKEHIESSLVGLRQG